MLNSVKTELGLQLDGIMGLPQEILLKILQYLDLKSVVTMSRINSLFHGLYKEDMIWQSLFLKQFPTNNRATKSNSNQSWYEYFKTAYEEEVQRKRALQRFENIPPRPPMFPYPDYDIDPSGPDMPPVPGIVGGDYDRYPGGGMLPGMPGLPGLRLPRPRFDPPGPSFPRGPRPGRGGFGGNSPFGGGGGGFGGFF